MNWPWSRCTAWRREIGLLAADCLPEASKSALEAHLGACPACHRYALELGAIGQSLRQWIQHTPTPAVTSEQADRWARAIHTAQRDNESDCQREPRVLLGEMLRLVTWPRLAAALVVLVWLLHAGFSLSTPSLAPAPAASPSLSGREIWAALQWLRSETAHNGAAPYPLLSPSSAPHQPDPRSEGPNLDPLGQRVVS